MDNFSSAFSLCEQAGLCAHLEDKVEAVLPADVEFGGRQDIAHLQSFFS